MLDFTCFLHLPLELQDKVWEAAIPPPAPTAFHARLVRQPMGRALDGSIDSYNVKDRVLLYRLPPDAHPDLADRDCVMATLSGMLVTCRRSFAVATRAYSSIKPFRPFLLRGQDPSVPYHTEIDAANDLLILDTGWQWPCRLISTSSVFRLQLPTPLRLLALAWPGPNRTSASDGRSAFYYSEALNGLLTLWGSRALRTLYVVVDPVHLHDAEKPWPAPADRSWATSSENDTVLEDYLASYHTDSCGRAVLFQRGARRYFEVPVEQVARSGGLGEVVELLESARKRLNPHLTPSVNQPSQEHVVQAMDSEQVPCRCVILSWR
ncbi:hypothetical protein CGRA01v4_13603 [Colletotrichum graminicola]|uniref:2EXR domain-containing protein n=1 Tax=Colletotrichum graminicola (strain M1.001 / M2 / FGSC 10212) TaxID=645133 RepID=E3QRL3_COLGM|nr:uncharacterized protein GLRG_08780 [Colletotrichum graminicola M1.001]EFQ33501.1 hypothetical protein GLRG_08780 [Colletotrichum graminicola M1.001]WDK22313.1 hypothetical protein CGRA01v4_13603 [Colletotrichum graminicola]